MPQDENIYTFQDSFPLICIFLQALKKELVRLICDLEKFKEYPHIIFHRLLKKQESPKGDFHWAANFPGGGGGCTLRPPGLSLTTA